MSHFKELCEVYAVEKQRRKNTETILYREMRRLVNFYEKWLDLPRHILLRDSDIPPYIEYGIVDNDNYFSKKQLKDIVINNDFTLDIAISTTIPASYCDPTPDIDAIGVILRLHMMLENKEADRIVVEVNGDEPIFVNIHEDEETDYQDVTFNMKKHILNKIKSNPPIKYIEHGFIVT